MVRGFHHVTLNVSDLQRSRRFYEALPGFVVDQEVPGRKLRFRIGDAAARLVLRPPLPGTPEGDQFSEKRIGLDHVAIGVSSREELEAILKVLNDLGAETDGIHLDRAGEAAMITFRDPDHIQWEFFEER
ncbi:VOC family protein [Natronosporangium hydrolyticum]|uniref:VOC family protein n=1 Tax=Natronosporangium hydrolyticum TaxID=2811111 RepID=A0A895YF80_9ACTN|nr:VOC family protein [Natronosporangium hydrolyticum]QSB16241.1 VOC family protein [Natronosporangium hydrolyticum]